MKSDLYNSCRVVVDRSLSGGVHINVLVDVLSVD
jgi:hypothetical protein